ncbi:MAG: zf-HC2 domain-containing protein, partial [Candidatus Eremiobacteraeota bacterium]|nr:zf-HC2 domain-containing protein [Candidatus Eremiobacteraeota bacterium]
MIPNAHIGDDAELYAAGALTRDEHAAVDAHIAQCPDCLRRVGEAEETVLAL